MKVLSPCFSSYSVNLLFSVTVCAHLNEVTVCISSSLLGIKTLEKILLSCSTIHEDCVYCMGITFVWYCLFSLLLDNSLICGAP